MKICKIDKGLGGGLPVSGVVSTTEISDKFHKNWSYFNTTAATPVQAAVASTVIDIIDEEELVDNANKVGAYLKEELIKWVRKEIGPIATPDKIQWAPGLPKTRSGKIMRRILRKIANDDYENLGDISTLADPNVVDELIKNKI